MSHSKAHAKYQKARIKPATFVVTDGPVVTVGDRFTYRGKQLVVTDFEPRPNAIYARCRVIGQRERTKLVRPHKLAATR